MGPWLVEFYRWYIKAAPWRVRRRTFRRAKALIDTAQGPRVYERVGGHARMVLDLGESLDKRIYFNFIDAAPLKLLHKLLRPGDVFVDAGANRGLFTVVAAHRVAPDGRVYAFEPQPGVLPALHDNVRLNHPDVTTVFSKGLWHEPGAVKLNVFNEHGTVTASVANVPVWTVRETVPIEVVRLDDVVPPPVRLIKVDLEGSDWNALRGAEQLLRGPSPPHLIVEINDTATRAMGYAAVEMVDWLLAVCPSYQMRLIKKGRQPRLTRDDLDRLSRSDEEMFFNVWFSPEG